MSLILEDNILALGAILFGIAWFGFWIDSKAIGKKISGVVWVLSGAMLLSNFHIIPFKSPVYDFVGGTLVPLAIPMLLFKADLRKIFKESGKVMVTFAIASGGTIAGAIIGFHIIELGEMGARVAGVYSGGWIGGAVNVLAVSQAVEMTPEEFSITVGASSQVSNLALLLLILIPSVPWIVRAIPSSIMQSLEDGKTIGGYDNDLAKLRLTHISGIIAISFAICALSQYLAELLSLSQYTILIITVLAIGVANIFPKTMTEVKGDFELGMLLMYLFFAAVGAGTDATSFISSAFSLFFYGLFIIFIHLIIVLTVARIFKIDLAEALVGSGAALVGPAVTAAIAISKGWRNLITPAIMCGIFGYAIGTFIGVAITALLS